jgi:RPA family protein
VCKCGTRYGGDIVSGSHARIFAGELHRTRYRCAEEEGSGQAPAVLTPTGLCCHRLFLVGALLEVEGKPGEMLQARVADPTGAFTLKAGRTEAGATAVLSEITPPAFVAVTGTPLLLAHARNARCQVVPAGIRTVTREIRDAWVIRTAGATVGRLEMLAAALAGSDAPDMVMASLREYRLGTPDLAEMGLMVQAALESIRPAPLPSVAPPDPVDAIRQAMAARGPKVQVPLEEILADGAARGLDREAVLSALAALMEEGDCYMPRKGFYRLV